MNKEKNLYPRKVAIVIFYDENLNLLVQKRNTRSKVGEKFGFFGGEIEVGETSEQALRRELKEELNYSPDKLQYWGKFYFTIILTGSSYDGDIHYGELFLSPITQELMGSDTEGDTEMALLPLDSVLENRNYEFGPVKFNDVVKIKKDLYELSKTRG